ncbi:hypothetical protein GCM10010493_49090 [Streptomyces lavendulae subsp. grasserius]
MLPPPTDSAPALRARSGAPAPTSAGGAQEAGDGGAEEAVETLRGGDLRAFGDDIAAGQPSQMGGFLRLARLLSVRVASGRGPDDDVNSG